jgi:hypothetical protein
LAVSAYSEQGLLKKNPLLGTSLAVDPGRGVEREKFGKLHERAMDFTGTKEEFQSGIQGEYDASRDKGLAAFAKSQEALSKTQGEVKDFRTKMRENQNIQRKNAEMRELIQSGNMKKATAFEKANPEIAKAASELWQSKLDEGLKKDDLKSYYKGKRSGINTKAYEELELEFKEQEKILNEQMPDLMKQMQEQQALLTRPGGAGGAKGVLGSQVQDVALGVQNMMGGALANTFGQGLMDWDRWKDDPVGNITSMMGADPFLKMGKGDIMGGLKDIALNAFDPGNIIGLAKSVFGLGSKKKKRAAMRNMRAGGRMGLLQDEMGLETARAGLENMQSNLGLASATVKAGGQQQTVTQQRKTLEDQANFYGSFFS